MTVANETVRLTGNLIIGSEEIRGDQGEFAAVDPRTGDTLEPSYGLGGGAEVERAAVLASEAFATYRQTDSETRAAFLDTIAEQIEALGDQLIDRVQAESGLPRARVESERARTTNQLRLFAAVVREGSWRRVRVDPAQPDRAQLPRTDIRQRSIPLGPVAAFGASNFQLAFSLAVCGNASATTLSGPAWARTR